MWIVFVDAAHTLTCAMMLLNTDLHGQVSTLVSKLNAKCFDLITYLNESCNTLCNDLNCNAPEWLSACPPHAVGHGFAPQQGHTKEHHKNGTTYLPAWHAGIRVGI